MATTANLIDQKRNMLGRPVGGMSMAPDTGGELGRGTMGDVTAGRVGLTAPPPPNMDRDMNAKIAQQKYYRDQDLAAGQKRGEQIFGSGALGRIDTAPSADMASIIAARRANLQGYTPEEMATMQNGIDKGVNSTMSTALRAAKAGQNQAGLNSGIAAGQNTQVAKAAIASKSDAQQQLMLNQIQQRRAALDAMSGDVGKSDTLSLQKQQYNQEQANKEKIGQLTTEFGYAGLGAADRSGVMQQVVGQAQADAMKAQAAQSGQKK